MVKTSCRYEFDGEDLGDKENCGADVTLFANGRVNGHIHYRGVEIKFSQALLEDVESSAAMVAYVAERIYEERAK